MNTFSYVYLRMMSSQQTAPIVKYPAETMATLKGMHYSSFNCHRENELPSSCYSMLATTSETSS